METGDTPPVTAIAGLVSGILDDCLGSIDAHIRGLDQGTGYAIAMSSADLITAILINHFAISEKHQAAMVVTHAKNVINRLRERKGKK